MMRDPILRSLFQSKYLRGLSKPSHPHTGLGLHANHQNDSMLTAKLTTDENCSNVSTIQLNGSFTDFTCPAATET